MVKFYKRNFIIETNLNSVKIQLKSELEKVVKGVQKKLESTELENNEKFNQFKKDYKRKLENLKDSITN